MKTKYLAPAIALPALALTFWGASAVSANGGFGGGLGFLSSEQRVQMQQTRFENEAEILGVNVSEVKDAWAQGKGVKELATEKGISEEDLRTKMQAKHKETMQSHLREMVSAGVITQAQADQRLEFMEKKQAEMKEQGPREGQGKMRMGRGMGPRMRGQRPQPQQQ